MNVWLVTVGEPLPVDSGSPRLLRAGLLAKYLVDAGHKVVWWSSTFDHQKKRSRAHTFREQTLADGTVLCLLHGRPYFNNVSLDRIRNHVQLARQFEHFSSKYDVPDIILCSYPTVELAEKAVKYGRKKSIPVVLDIRDLWPDAFLDLVPNWLHGIARNILKSYFRKASHACAGASAIFGITDAFRDWGVARAGRSLNSWDATFPMAYPKEVPESSSVNAANAYWDEIGVTAERAIACYFGTFGPYIDVETLVKAAEISRKKDPQILWVLCGTGPSFERCRDLGSGLKNLVLPGWVERAEIYSLMARARVGIVPYRDVANYSLNLPNKPIEYLSGGLPVVATIGGVLREKIADRGAGISVPSEDPRALAAAVVGLVQDPERQQRMATTAKCLYLREYVAETVYRRMIDHLEKIVTPDCGAGRETRLKAVKTAWVNRIG